MLFTTGCDLSAQLATCLIIFFLSKDSKRTKMYLISEKGNKKVHIVYQDSGKKLWRRPVSQAKMTPSCGLFISPI